MVDLHDERRRPCAQSLSLNSALSLGYYVPIISTLMFSWDGRATSAPSVGNQFPSRWLTAVVFLAIVTVYFGLFPESFTWISHAAGQIFTWGVA